MTQLLTKENIIQNALDRDLFNKIPQNANIVILGAGVVGQKMFDDIKSYRPDVNILGFIENLISMQLDLPVWTLKEFIDLKTDIDLVVFSTRSEAVSNILDIYDISFLPQTNFTYNHYRNKKEILNDDNYNKTINIFDNQDDKELFDLIFRVRADITSGEQLKNFYNDKYNKNNYLNFCNIKYHYIEKINRNAIKNIFDIGMSYGLNLIAFNKYLPNLEKIYGFEAIYDIAKIKYIEEFIMNNKLQIVPYAIGNNEGRISFLVNHDATTCSKCDTLTSMDITKDYESDSYEKIYVNMTTIDKYSSDNNISPDFIKMDIEGAELPALQGAIETIKKHRPQLAISIYHSDEDFINIPLFLFENLKNYHYAMGHYSSNWCETVLYAIPNELT